MIAIAYSGSSVDISGTEQLLAQINSNNSYYLSVDLVGTENDPLFQYGYVAATLDWNDGTPPVQFAKGQGSVRIQSTRIVQPGQYTVTVKVFNYRQPTQDLRVVTFYATVMPVFSASSSGSYMCGPILPRDVGFPNAQQWEFNVGYDNVLIASSIKMLLLTNVGERIMLPKYGTNVRRYLFSANIAQNKSLIENEIRQAIQQWEPRVTVNAVTVSNGNDSRSIIVAVNLQSLISGTNFNVAVNVAR